MRSKQKHNSNRRPSPAANSSSRVWLDAIRQQMIDEFEQETRGLALLFLMASMDEEPGSASLRAAAGFAVHSTTFH